VRLNLQSVRQSQWRNVARHRVRSAQDLHTLTPTTALRVNQRRRSHTKRPSRRASKSPWPSARFSAVVHDAEQIARICSGWAPSASGPAQCHESCRRNRVRAGNGRLLCDLSGEIALCRRPDPISALLNVCPTVSLHEFTDPSPPIVIAAGLHVTFKAPQPDARFFSVGS